MKYDFTKILDRAGRDSIAADAIPVEKAQVREGFSKIPMWVADMNFETAPTVIEEVVKRATHPAFGYFELPDEYYDGITRWHETRNNVKNMPREAIGYENGVLGGIVSALQAFTAPGDSVLLHAPTYIGFTRCIEDNGRKIILSDLVLDEDGVWRMDYEDMNRKIEKNNIHFAVFCSPHNPCGRVWNRDEIEKAMEVYKKNDCVVISDEIWSDLTLYNNQHIPTQSVSEDAKNRVIALYAPSKTFNLAGLVGSYHVIYNKYLRDRVTRQGEITHYNNINVLSVRALTGAYTSDGAEWVDELRSVLSDNVDYAYNHIKEKYKGISLAKPEGTYMLYLDCEEWCRLHGKDMDELLRKGIEVGVIWQDGRPFNRPYAIRMNLAVPYNMLVDAFDRLDKYVFEV